MNIPPEYPIDEVIYRSTRGFVLWYFSRGKLIVDIDLSYLDFLMERLESYEGKPNEFKKHCVEYLRRSLDSLDSGLERSDDLKRALRHLALNKLETFALEPEHECAKLCKRWRTNQEMTEDSMKSYVLKRRASQIHARGHSQRVEWPERGL